MKKNATGAEKTGIRSIPAGIGNLGINKTNTPTSIITQGDTLIGNPLYWNMLLIPFAIDPLGRFGPLLQNFLFGHHLAPLLRFAPSRPNSTQM